MIRLHSPEIIQAINGIDWTVVRCGRDEVGPFENWIGFNYKSYEEAELVSGEWEKSEPSFGDKDNIYE
jgi:hypothetical protein